MTAERKNTHERVCFIVNPAAAGGSTGARIPELERAASQWFSDWAVWRTERGGHATDLAAKACDDGFDVVVAVGGDGTAHEVVNGLFVDQRLRRPEVVFSVIPAGTGSDLIRSLGIPGKLRLAVGVIAHGDTRATDLIHARLDGDGTPHEELCINVAGFAMSGEVVTRANQSSKRLGGTVTFVSATARSLVAFDAPELSIRWLTPEGTEASWEGEAFNVFVANGHYCGGGMWVGKGGSMQDGALDLTIIPSMSLARTALHSPRLFTGTIDQVKGVVRARAVKVWAEAKGWADVRVDLDGEQPGRLPIELTVINEKLQVRGRWGG